MPRVLTQTDIAQFRDRTCAAAAALFVEVGYNKFTMRDLAKRLGSSAMTPYRYFENKGAILALVRARGFASLAGRLEDVLHDADRSAKDKSDAFVIAYLAFAADESAYYKLMFDDGGQKGGCDCAELDREERRVRALVDAYAGLLSNRDAESDHLGDLLWSALHGVAIFRLTNRTALPDEILVDAIAALVREGPLRAGVATRSEPRPNGKAREPAAVSAQ
jgi:AcrR family transcriptional regulator